MRLDFVVVTTIAVLLVAAILALAREALRPTDAIVLIVALVGGYSAALSDKTAWVRLVDVLVIGPAMLWIGFEQTNVIYRWALLAMGSATIAHDLQRVFAGNKKST